MLCINGKNVLFPNEYLPIPCLVNVRILSIVTIGQIPSIASGAIVCYLIERQSNVMIFAASCRVFV